MTDYEKQAEDFLKATKTEFKTVFFKHDKHFPEDKETRDIYKITLKCGERKYTFNFGQSLANQGIVPTAYDVLACLQKYDVGTFEDFCSNFGYDTDSRMAERTYKAVLNEWKNIQRLYTDEEIRQMQEIQ